MELAKCRFKCSAV